MLALSELPIPSAELGVHAVFAFLESEGLCELRTGSSRSPRRQDLAWADALVLVRGASPGELRLLREGQRLGRRVATYMDDDLEYVPCDARSAYFFRSAAIRRSLTSVLREADDLLVCSERLAAVLARRHGRATVMIRQPRPRWGGAAPGSCARGPVRIGFLGGEDHTGLLDHLLAVPLQRLHEEYGSRVSFVFCGARPAIAEDLGAERHEFVLGLAAWREKASHLGVSIGLAPIADTPFHRCKYWNKYLEYGSLGIVGVYSAFPPHRDVVADRRTGRLVPNDPEAWLAALRELIEDAALRERMAAAARADVEARFSERALAPGWRESLAPLLAHRAPSVSPDAVRLSTGPLRFALDRLAVYGPARFAQRALRRLTGHLRPG